MDWLDYREKLGIGFCDEEKFKYFKTKMFNELNINDRIAKHNDAVDAKMLEFLLYQTGILIRMGLSVTLAQETEVLSHAD